MTYREIAWGLLPFACAATAFGCGGEDPAELTGEVLLETQTDCGCEEGECPPPPSLEGRMTGGGSIFTDSDDSGVPSGTRITHGFELHCDASDDPNRLEINIHDDVGSRFHLLDLESAFCSDDPTIEPRPPSAPFDTYAGHGTGRYNGVAGYVADWVFTDAGEPGRVDRIVELSIRNSGGGLVLNVVSPGHALTFGNHQAHR